MTLSFSKYEARSPTDLIISTRVSRGYQTYIIALHVSAFCAVFLTPNLPAIVWLSAIPLLLLNARAMLRSTHTQGTWIWRGLGEVEYNPDTSNGYQSRAMQPFSGTVTSRSMHCFLFVLLELRRSDNYSEYYVIARDAASVGDFRRLRARLYLGKRVSLSERPDPE